MEFKYKDLNINYEIFIDEKFAAKLQEQKEHPSDDKIKITEYPPLLLLHGWMANIKAMYPIYRYFMQTRKVYVLDFPGQGGFSSELTEAWGVPEYSEMVKAFIESQNIKGCDVIGHSFGGRVSIYLASNYPDLFNRIILTDSAGIKSKMTFKKFVKIYSYKLSKAFFKLVLSKERYEDKLLEMRIRKGSADYGALTSDIMRETFNKVINLDLTSNLPQIKNSCLLIWGKNDVDTPMYMAKIMEKQIPDSGLVVIENAGHFSYIDNSNQYLLVANSFLN